MGLIPSEACEEMIGRPWAHRPLEERLAQAARDYLIPRQYPALSGMIDSPQNISQRYSICEEALLAYVEACTKYEEEVL